MEHNVRRYANKKLKKNHLSEIIRDGKRVPCADCGNTFETFAMDYDHRESGTKCFNVSRGHGGSISEAMIRAEIAKCDVVCAVCHRYRTHKRKQVAAAILTE